MKALYDQREVEVCMDHQHVALHLRSNHQKAYATAAEHMLPHHQRMQQIKGSTLGNIPSKQVQHNLAALMSHSLQHIQPYQ